MSDQPPHRSQPLLVPIAALVLAGSPRLAGEDPEHIRLLAEAGAELPPIVVHRRTMRVIDGMHRVRAARLRRQSRIPAVFFDGDADAAFLHAVVANVSHGRPLTLADRRAAAVRVLKAHPEWSDRGIATATGLAPMTVRTLRQRATGGSGQLRARLGRDGRVRPLDASEGRRRAATLLADQPGATLKEIAQLAGVSVGTVRDVRRRVRSGEDPVPSTRRRSAPRGGGTRHEPARPVAPAAPVADVTGARGVAGANGAPDAAGAPGARGAAGPARHGGRPDELRPDGAVLAGLKQDPYLRDSEHGRRLLGWLDTHLVRVDDWVRVAEAVPPHCAYPVAELAAGCARAWSRIAEELLAEEVTAAGPRGG